MDRKQVNPTLEPKPSRGTVEIPRLQGSVGCVLAFALALVLYAASAGTKINEQSRTPHHVYLAYTFLHGRADLIEPPEGTYDLIEFEDRWYVAGGPAPAVLLMPAVAAFGLDASDIFFGAVLGAVNVALMFHLLGTLLPGRNGVRNLLTVLFAAGTPHWWLSSLGSVWFNAQLAAALFMLLFASETIGRGRPFLVGAWLGLAALCRPTTLFALPFYPLYLAADAEGRPAWLRKQLGFGAALLGAVALMLVYNAVRFRDPLDFGYGGVQGARSLVQAFRKTGGFSLQYLPCNLYVSLLGLPNLPWSPLPAVEQMCPHLARASTDFGDASQFFNPIGMSIFLATPAFLLIFRSRLTDRQVKPAWISMLFVLLPLWMYHNTGWGQFGYRYILDVIPFLFILLASSIRTLGRLEVGLVTASVLMTSVGLYLMFYKTFEYLWSDMFVDGIRILLSAPQ